MCGNKAAQDALEEDTLAQEVWIEYWWDMGGDKDRCKLKDNSQGSGISRWLVGGEVCVCVEGGGVVEVTSNQRRGIAVPHPLSFCTPCPQQYAPTAPTPTTNHPRVCCVSKKKVCYFSSPLGPAPPHIKAASFSLNVNIKSVDHKSQHSLHKLPLPQPLILPSDEGEEREGSYCERKRLREGETEREREWERWR